MKIIVGSRPSKLAITQTEQVLQALKLRIPDLDWEIKPIKTTGDMKQNLGSNVSRDKKDWLIELEDEVMSGGIDLAIHSGKDVPYDIFEETEILSVSARANPYDVFIGKTIDGSRIKLRELPVNAKVATASLRRAAQLKSIRPDLEILELRGNITSRIAKLEEGNSFSGLILAASGLKRIGYDLGDFEIIPADLMLPAASQGILAAQYRKSRKDLAEIVQQISDADTQASFLAERAVIRGLKADCKSAVGCFSTISGEELTIRTKIFDTASPAKLDKSITGSKHQPDALGLQLADILLADGATELLRL